MALYRVEADMTVGGKTVVDGANVAIVSAADATNAKAVAAADNPGLSTAAWAAGTVTEIAAPADLEGFRLRLQLVDPATSVVTAAVEVTGVASAGVDSIAALAVIALNATASIANASYLTKTLTVAAIADALGDHKLYATWLPPITWEAPETPMPAFISTIVDEGIAGADVTLLLVDAAVPGMLAAYNQLH